MTSIPISQLDNFTIVRDEDFVALVDSSSLTTYRVPVTSLGAWMAVSGSVISSSYASASGASISSSWASSSISASVSGHLTWPNTSTASFAQRALSSSWSDRSGYALASLSASWSETASYFDFSLPSSTPPFADACTSASWASASLSSSYALSASWADRTMSASYAITASYVDTASYARTASVLLNSAGGVTRNYGGIGGSWRVANPGGAFAVDNDLYVYNQNNQTGRMNLVKINMQTNVVTYLKQWPQNSWNWYGRPFRNSGDGKVHTLAFTDDGLYDYNVTDDTAPSLISAGGYWEDLPVKVVTWPAAAAGDFYCLYGGSNAGTYGNYPYFRWRRHYYSGGTWHETWASANLTISSVANNTELRKFLNFSTDPLHHQNTLLWDFNYIKKRYYLMGDDTGYMHIFSQTTGDIETSWLNASITYEKTIAVPLPNTEILSDIDTEHIHIDYDVDTGEEKGIVLVRRGNQSYHGCITYVNWPEINNW